jgi:hypothetical protein
MPRVGKSSCAHESAVSRGLQGLCTGVPLYSLMSLSLHSGSLPREQIQKSDTYPNPEAIGRSAHRSGGASGCEVALKGTWRGTVGREKFQATLLHTEMVC